MTNIEEREKELESKYYRKRIGQSKIRRGREYKGDIGLMTTLSCITNILSIILPTIY